MHHDVAVREQGPPSLAARSEIAFTPGRGSSRPSTTIWKRSARHCLAGSFETGADRYFSTLSAAAPAGAPGIRLGTSQLAYLKPGDTLVIGGKAPAQERRTVASIVRPNPSSPAPNVLFTQPLANAHEAGTRVEGEALQTGVGFQPDYATEGKFEALEFAAGNFGLLESALAYPATTRTRRCG